MAYELVFLKMLGITLVTEIITLLVMMRYVFRDVTPLHRIIGIGAIATGLTLPYLWFIFPYFLQDKMLYITMSELFAVVVEMGIYRMFLRTSWSKSSALSLICNMMSFSLGVILFWR